jgi:hypothetical protein
LHAASAHLQRRAGKTKSKRLSRVDKILSPQFIKPVASVRTDEARRRRESLKNFGHVSKQNSGIICPGNNRERIGCFHGMRFVETLL